METQKMMELAVRAMDVSGHAIYMADPEGNIFYSNRKFSEITGYSYREVLGKNPRFLKSGLMSEDYYKRLWKALMSGVSWEEDVTNLRKDGQIYWAYQTISPIKNDLGELIAFIAVQNDISTQKALESALAESEARYKSVISAMSEGLILINSEREIVQSNKASENILRINLEKSKGKASFDQVWGAIKEDGSKFPLEEHPALVTLKTGTPVDGVVMGIRGEREKTLWISMNSRPIFVKEQSEPDYVLTTFTDITENKQKHDEMRKISETDFLTGLLNRRALVQKMDIELSRARRHKFPLTVIMIDFDFFKKINDTYGHDAGDTVLKVAGTEISSSLRAGDMLARWGGEEFLLLAPHTSKEQSMILAERLRLLMESLSDQFPAPVTISLGVSTSDESYFAAASVLIEQADKALYYAKENGRNRACFYEAALSP